MISKWHRFNNTEPPYQQLNAQIVWQHLHFGCPRHLTRDRWNHDYHTAEANINAFKNLSCETEEKEQSPIMKRGNAPACWSVKGSGTDLSHRHKSSEHLLKIPASWGLNSIKPQDMHWFWKREICPLSALLSTSKYPQLLAFTSL